MAYTIYLDAGIESKLDFEKEKVLVIDAIKKGLKVSFEVDLGLFSRLKKPLSNQSQYLSLELSLEHFKKTFWDEFHEEIDEICLYRGLLNFAEDFIFDEAQQLNLQAWIKDHFLDVAVFFEETGIQISDFSEINPEILSLSEAGKQLRSYFCRDASLEYLHILRANLPDEMPLSIKLDAKGITDPLFHARLTNREHYQPFILNLMNSEICQVDLIIEGKKSNIAVCLPEITTLKQSAYSGLREALDYFIEKNIPYRLIPESFLISEWDLVDYLFVSPNSLKKEGVRKLQGFAAAGGIVVTLGQKIGVPGEISFIDYEALISV